MTTSLVGDATKLRIFAASVDNLLAMFAALFTASELSALAAARPANRRSHHLPVVLLDSGSCLVEYGRQAHLRVMRPST